MASNDFDEAMKSMGFLMGDKSDFNWEKLRNWVANWPATYYVIYPGDLREYVKKMAPRKETIDKNSSEKI